VDLGLGTVKTATSDATPARRVVSGHGRIASAAPRPRPVTRRARAAARARAAPQTDISGIVISVRVPEARPCPLEGDHLHVLAELAALVEFLLRHLEQERSSRPASVTMRNSRSAVLRVLTMPLVLRTASARTSTSGTALGVDQHALRAEAPSHARICSA